MMTRSNRWRFVRDTPVPGNLRKTQTTQTRNGAPDTRHHPHPPSGKTSLYVTDPNARACHTLPIADPVVSAGGQHLSEDVHEEKTKHVASAADGREIRRVNVFRHVPRRPGLGHLAGFRRGRGPFLLRHAAFVARRVPRTVTVVASHRHRSLRRRSLRRVVRTIAVRLVCRRVLVRVDRNSRRGRLFFRSAEEFREIDAGRLQLLVTSLGRYPGLKTSSVPWKNRSRRA